MHQPMLPAAHQPGPKPPRPSRNPNPEAERPQIPKPPPGPTPEQCGRQAGNLRPPAQASPAAPHAAARETASREDDFQFFAQPYLFKPEYIDDEIREMAFYVRMPTPPVLNQHLLSP